MRFGCAPHVLTCGRHLQSYNNAYNASRCLKNLHVVLMELSWHLLSGGAKCGNDGRVKRGNNDVFFFSQPP